LLDGKRDKLQITFSLLTQRRELPVVVEVFEPNTADPTTLSSVIAKLCERFALKRRNAPLAAERARKRSDLFSRHRAQT